MSRFLAAILGVAAFVPVLGAAGYRVGVARLDITPRGPIWLSGYASRNHASEGVLTPLYAKALAIEDPKGSRVVIVTTDLIGLPRAISDFVAARVTKEYGLERSRLVLNSSHTHTGPVLRGNLETMWALDASAKGVIREYGMRLTDALVTVTGAALGDLRPARVYYGEGTADFAVNRREPSPKGIRLGINPQGPRDTTVPVLQVLTAEGGLRAVLFGYACHNTTLTGEHYQISGDYAGFAQLEFEKSHPGATALFFQLCGADANPNPRGTVELAAQHGKELAAAVDRVLSGKLRPVRPPLRAAFRIIEPALAFYTRESLEQRLNDRNPAAARNAAANLKAWDDGHPVRRIPYPVQAVQFGKDLTLVALGGEVVVDYALRAKREFNASRQPLIVAGYSNDVMCYIPSAAVLKGGGYEPLGSMIYYGLPAPFTSEIEETVFDAMRDVVKRVGR